MWANDFRLASSLSHFWTLRPSPMRLISTGRFCHITAAPSGTSPSIFRLSRFKMYPYGPAISALGMRGVLDMLVLLSMCRHEDTARAAGVTGRHSTDRRDEATG